jgi:hypothetical protein
VELANGGGATIDMAEFEKISFESKINEYVE